MQLPTITDVARSAGVSTATVSRYLRGQRVRDAERIESAVGELGFRPSPAARSLKSGVRGSIGVVVPDITNPYFAAVVKGVESVARQDDFHIFLCNTEESAEREHAVLATLFGRVDGLILAPVTEDAESLIGLRRLGIPIVFLDRELREGDGFDTVLVDNQGGARRAAEYLAGLGHERIGVISGPLQTTPGRGRYEGFVGALEHAGSSLDPAYVRFGDFRQESGYQATLRLLALPVPPTAIFAANNMMSIGALRALHDLGVQLPEDMSFLGFDDIDLGEILTPPLTVVSRPTVEQGVLAMRLLGNRLDGMIEPGPRRVILDTELTIRGSCREAPAEVGAVARNDGRGRRETGT